MKNKRQVSRKKQLALVALALTMVVSQIIYPLGGVANGIVDTQYQSSAVESTEASTEGNTEDSTVESTEGNTEESTAESTEGSTEESTAESTESSTEESTEASTESSTEESTVESTEGSTEESTAESTESSTEESTVESAKDGDLLPGNGILTNDSRNTSDALNFDFPDDKFTVTVAVWLFNGMTLRSVKSYPQITSGSYPQEGIEPKHYLEITIVPKSGTVEDWFEGDKPPYLVKLSGASHTTFKKGKANNYIIDGADLGQSGLSKLSASTEGTNDVLIDFSIVENLDAEPETGEHDLRFSFPAEFKVTATITEGANPEKNMDVESSTIYSVATDSSLGVAITPADPSANIKELLGGDSLYKVEMTGLTADDFRFDDATNSYRMDAQPVIQNIILSIHDALSERTRITLRPPVAEYIYDGTAHTYTHRDSDFNFVESGALRKGDRLEAEALSEGSTAGGHHNRIKSYNIYRNNRDVTTEYDIGLNPGAVTILPRPVYLSAHSGTFEYDGQVHTLNEWSVLKPGDTYIDKRTGSDVTKTIPDEAYPILDKDMELFNQSVSVKGSIKLPGWEYNIIDCLNVANYEINRCHGTLTITPRTLSIVTPSLAWDYDAKIHSLYSEYNISPDDGYIPLEDLLQKGINLQVTGLAEGDIIRLGDWSTIGPSRSPWSAQGPNNIEENNGFFQLSNGCSFSVYRDGQPVTSAYTMDDSNLTLGKLQINAIPLYLSIDKSDVTIWAGEALPDFNLKASGFVKESEDERIFYSKELINGETKSAIDYTIHGLTEAQHQQAGIYDNNITYTKNISEAGFGEIIHLFWNYNLEAVAGTIRVKDRLTLTADSATTVYSGSNQTAQGYRVSKNGYEVSGVSTTGGGLYVGTYATNVTGTPVIQNQNGQTITDLIEYTTNSGILTILGEVTYNANDGVTTVHDTGTYQKGTVIPVHGQGDTARKNAKFLGWSTTKHALLPIGSTGKGIDMVQSVTMEDTSITLYAVWAKTRTTDPDSGTDSGSPSTPDPKPSKPTEPTEPTVPNPGPGVLPTEPVVPVPETTTEAVPESAPDPEQPSVAKPEQPAQPTPDGGVQGPITPSDPNYWVDDDGRPHGKGDTPDPLYWMDDNGVPLGYMDGNGNWIVTKKAQTLPKTGDEANGARLIFWLSCIGLAGIVIDRKRRDKKVQ